MTVNQTSYSAADLAHWREAILRAAAEAAAYIAGRAKGRSDIVWREKSETDFVSDVDIGAEELIRASLQASIRGLRYIGEELGPEGDASTGLVAVVDPLDGTTNFLHGYPAYAVSIGIVLDGVPVAGVVHDVARGGVYSATAGGGAYLNDVPIFVSTNTLPARALIGTGFPFKSMAGTAQYLTQLETLIPQVAGVRRGGSAALDLCDVASGRFDGFWELSLAPWDVAAGMLLIREAGGLVTDFAGAPARVGDGPIVAGNAALHPWFLEQLNRRERAADRSEQRSDDRSVDAPVERTTTRTLDLPIQRTANRPVDRLNDRPNDQIDDRSLGQPWDRPVR